VATTIAHALGVGEVAGKPIEESLRSFLRAKRTLLLLDNFEQILDAAPLVAELLAAAPNVKVLITSRAVLHLYGEHEFAVPPLALPPTNDHRRLTTDDHAAERRDVITQYEAVRLFIARAQAAKADFAVTNANAPAVAEICVRLDGLPLAIELAAARIKLFPPEALLARLGNRLQVLTGGPRDLPARQQTLRNAIEWSYNLLNPDEQALFRRLGVFVGGCTLEAAEGVCRGWELGDGGWDDAALTPIPHPLTPIVEGLVALVDQSLLRQEEGVDGEPRFVMLETMREYALELLAERGELAQTQRQHAQYFLELAERAEPEINGPQMQIWLNRLEANYDNLRTVLAWSLRGQYAPGSDEQKASTLGLRLAGALPIFWTARNRHNEGLAWIDGCLERNRNIATSPPPSVRMKALNAAGYMAVAKGDHKRATALLEESVTLSRDMGDQIGTATALVQLGRLARFQGHYGQAERLEEEGLALFRSEGDKSGITLALLSLSDAALEQGALDRATGHLQEALAICQDVGLVDWTLWVTYNLGRVAHLQGDHARALSQLEESLTQFRDLDYTMGVGNTLTALAQVAHVQGDDSKAAQYFAKCLALLSETPFSESQDAALEGMAGVAAARGQPERAARLFGAAEAQREAYGPSLAPAYHAAYEHDVAAARAQLDEVTFAAAWEQGRKLTLEQAIAEALSDDLLRSMA
jgi:predicted ATPase